MEDVRAVFEPALIWAYLVLEDFFFPYMNKEAWHVRGLEFGGGGVGFFWFFFSLFLVILSTPVHSRHFCFNYAKQYRPFTVRSLWA